MSKNVRIQVNLDAKLVEQAEQILAQLGYSRTTAIRVFYSAIVAQRAFPIKAELAQPEEDKAMEEAIALIIKKIGKDNIRDATSDKELTKFIAEGGQDSD